MNLISETHHSCEKREHAFMVLREYTIIFPQLDIDTSGFSHKNIVRNEHNNNPLKTSIIQYLLQKTSK